tara:strand:+ start:514 stop:1017 length:504 start_codon:yes stop_codon:yes gene_type:complete
VRKLFLTAYVLILSLAAIPAHAQSEKWFGSWQLVDGGPDTGCLATFRQGSEQFHLYAGPISDGALMFRSDAIAQMAPAEDVPVELTWFVEGGQNAVATVPGTVRALGADGRVLGINIPLDQVTSKLLVHPRMAARSGGVALFDITLPTDQNSSALYAAFLECRSRNL